MKRIVLFIRSLDTGGAERQLVVLAKGLKALGTNLRVLVFYPGGPLHDELEDAGIVVVSLGKKGRWDLLPFFLRLVAWLKRERPDILYSFLPSANVLGLLAGRLAGVPKIVWGIRASNIDLSRYDWMSRFETYISSMLSRFADQIICNSEAGLRYHDKLGYPSAKMVVVENGIDTDRFRFDEVARKRMREQWNVGDGIFVVGIAARHDPMKDYETFLCAARQLVSRMEHVRFVCVGEGRTEYTEKLRKMAEQMSLSDHVIWAGRCSDMAAVYSGFDIASSSSYGEGFSNAIAEAMSCERMCVVTDVGDSARIVADTGVIVQPGDPGELANAWEAVLRLPAEERARRGRAARDRIVREFGIALMVEKTGKELGLC